MKVCAVPSVIGSANSVLPQCSQVSDVPRTLPMIPLLTPLPHCVHSQVFVISVYFMCGCLRYVAKSHTCRTVVLIDDYICQYVHKLNNNIEANMKKSSRLTVRTSGVSAYIHPHPKPKIRIIKLMDILSILSSMCTMIA